MDLATTDTRLAELDRLEREQSAALHAERDELHRQRRLIRSGEDFRRLVEENPLLPEVAVLLHVERCGIMGPCDLSWHTMKGQRDWTQYHTQISAARKWFSLMDDAGVDHETAVAVKRAEIAGRNDEQPLHQTDNLAPDVTEG